MRLLIQRVSKAKVIVNGEIFGEIGRGLLIFLGVGEGDSEDDCSKMAEKVVKMRIFQDENEKMNLDVSQISGSILIVSQFTLYADTRKGNRPSFVNAGKPEEAKKIYEYFIKDVKGLIGENNVATGVFGAMMDVELINDGPVTIWVDSC